MRASEDTSPPAPRAAAARAAATARGRVAAECAECAESARTNESSSELRPPEEEEDLCSDEEDVDLAVECGAEERANDELCSSAELGCSERDAELRSDSSSDEDALVPLPSLDDVRDEDPLEELDELEFPLDRASEGALAFSAHSCRTRYRIVRNSAPGEGE